MIDTLVIVVYNRFDNIEKWLHIWKQCDIGDTRLVIIHNKELKDPYYEFKNAITVSRPNKGFDIGAFQDVCKDRLPGFPTDWQQLLWCTDDTFPTTPDFLKHFALGPGEGCRAMEISPYVREHVRTTGFSITKEVARRLQFPADPITTKQQCYLFEHRWYNNIFIDQVRRMKLSVTMVALRETSPMFDTGYHRRLPRDQELNARWGIEQPIPGTNIPKVTIICPIYKSFPAIISSFIMQTFKDWKLILIHDGPADDGVQSFVRSINDDRIEYIETAQHVGSWGHSIRAEYLQTVKSQYVLITNADNQYVPVFLEYMLEPLERGNGAVATYCSAMVHSYQKWATQACHLIRGHLDCGGVLLKTKEAQAVGWHSVEHSADWFFFEAIIKRYGARKFIPVKGTLFIHN